MIELKNVRRVFGSEDTAVNALNGVSLSIKKGKMVAIIGPSGSGKTTLMNILGCIDIPTSGQYLLDGRDVGLCSKKEMAVLRNEKFGFVIQDFALIKYYTVYQNILLPIRYSKKATSEENRDKVEKMLKRLSILDKIDEYPTKLSGGQKQRVAIARALINDPGIILADEPTGALDQKTGQEIVELFREINQLGKTVIIVTHDMNIANQCDEIIKLCDGVCVS